MNRKFQEKDLVLATHNFGKIEEFKHLFGEVNFNITDIGQYSPKIPEETGESFWKNSLINHKDPLVKHKDSSGNHKDSLETLMIS